MKETRDVSKDLQQLAVGMPNFVSVAIFFLLLVTGLGFAVVVGMQPRMEPLGLLLGLGSFLVAALVASAVKVANQWERAIVLRLGEFQGIRGPGLFFILPILDRVRLIDTRILTIDVRRQEVITRDNVPVTINGVLFFKVTNVQDAIMQIQDYSFAVTQLAQTALRDVVGGMSLDEVLAERDRVGQRVEEIVDKDSRAWGLEVTSIRLQDIDMPEDLKKIMSRQAAAEREKRATITKAEGDKLAAENLAAAASTMAASPGAMQLRTLQTLDGLGPTASNTVVLALPVDVLEMARKYVGSRP